MGTSRAPAVVINQEYLQFSAMNNARGYQIPAVVWHLMEIFDLPGDGETKSLCRHLMSRLKELLRCGIRLVGLWCRRIRDRRRLAVLTDRELRDIGLSRCDAH